MEVGADLVALTLLQVVALSATGLVIIVSVQGSWYTSVAQEVGRVAHTLKRPAPFLASPEISVSIVCYVEIFETR